MLKKVWFWTQMIGGIIVAGVAVLAMMCGGPGACPWLE